MRSKAKAVLLSALLLIVVLIVAAGFFVKSEYFAAKVCGMIEKGVKEGLGLKATIGSCSLELLPPALESQRVEVLGQGGGRLFNIEKLRVEVDSVALLTGRLQPDRIQLEGPEIHLVVNRQGTVTNVQLPKGHSGASVAAGQDLTSLPARLDVEGGRINLVVEGSALVQLQDLRLSVLRKGERQFRLMVDHGAGSLDLVGGQGSSLKIDNIKGRASLEGGDLDIARSSIDIGEVSLAAHGKYSLRADGPTPEVNLKVSGPLVLLHTFLPEVPPMAGHATVNAATTVGRKGVEARGTLDVNRFGIESVSGVDLKADFVVNPDRVSLENLRASSAAGKVSGTAHLELVPPFQFGGSLNIEQTDLKEALNLGGIRSIPVLGRVRGSLEFQGRFQGKSGPYVVLDSRLGLDKLALLRPDSESPVLSVEGGKLQAQAAFSGRRVRFPGFRFELATSLIEGYGKIGFRDGSVVAAIRAPRLTLADFSIARDLGLDGTASLALGIGGTFLVPVLDARVEAENLVVRGRRIGAAKGRVVLAKDALQFDKLVLAQGTRTAQLTGSVGTRAPYGLDGTVELEGMPAGEIASMIVVGEVPIRLAGLVSGRVKAAGSLEAPRLDFHVAFRDVWVGPQRFDEGGALGQYDSGNLRLDLIEARMGPGWVFAQGGISRALELDLSAYSTGLRLASFQPLQDWKEVLDFRLDLHVGIKGPLHSPALQGWAKFYDTNVGGRLVEDSFFSAQATNQSFEVEGRFLGGAAVLSGQAALQEGLPFSSLLKFGTDHLEKYIPGAARTLDPSTVAHGSLSMEGRLLALREIRGELRLDRVALGAGGIRLQNRQPILVGFQNGEFAVRQCQISGTKTSLEVRGGGSVVNGPSLTAEGTVRLEALRPVLGFLQQAAGRANVRLGIGGGWANPTLSGSASFSADLLRFSWLPLDLQEVTGALQVSPQLLEIPHVTGKVGGGTFSTQGWVSLKNFVPERIELAFDLDRVRYQASKGLWGKGTGTLLLTGMPTRMLQLSGEMTVQEGEFREEIELIEFNSGLFRRRRAPAPTYDVRRETLGFDVRFLIPSNFRVSYNLGAVGFSAEMKGDLRLTGTSERLGLLGEVEALEGTVAYLSKDFAVQTARVQFIREYEVHPRLDILASWTESIDRGDEGETSYQVDLRLAGEEDAIRVSLKSIPSLDERDIITLLSLGVTSRDIESLKSENLVAPVGEILFKAYKLDEKLRRAFPFPPEVIQPKYFRLRSRFSMKSGTAPRLETGAKLRLLSDKLDWDFSGSLFDGTDQVHDLSYQIGEGVFTRLRWENTRETDFGNTGIDLKLHWEW